MKAMTCTNLLECFNDWTLALQDRNGVDIVYIDFAKAFNSVSNAKPIHRLRNKCIDDPLLLWISTFLSDRSHCTRVGNTDSATVALISFAMIVGRQPSFDVNILINSISLPYVTPCKDLGATVCSSLYNSSHIANIVSAADQRCLLLLRSFTTPDLKILTFIYYLC